MNKINCPNCGAPIEQNAIRCPYCGTSYFDFSNLEVEGKPIAVKLKLPNNMALIGLAQLKSDISLEYNCSTTDLIGRSGNHLMRFNNIPTCELTLHFDMLIDPTDNNMYKIYKLD